MSRKSAEEVERVIKMVQPGTIMVELCPERAKRIMEPQQKMDGNVLAEVLKALGMPGDLTQKLLGAGLKGMYAVLKHTGLEPGLEFKVALQQANALRAKVVLGDRDVHQTLQRLSKQFSLPDLMRMMIPGAVAPPPPELERVFQASTSMEEGIERMKNRSTVRAMVSYMRQNNPGAVRVILDERDDIMAEALMRCEGRVVGVVGLAHLDGIEARWNEAQSRAGGGGGSIAAR